MVDAHTAGPITFKAAEWSVGLSYDSIPDDVVVFAKRSILDGIGCAIRGLAMEAGGLISNYVHGAEALQAEATIWGSGQKQSARLAGLVNGTTAHVPNIGDSFNAHPIHINYLMPQAAIAVGEKEGANGRDIITAFVAGTEITTRAGLATHLSDEGGYFDDQGRGWQTTGAVGGIGASVTAGRMLGLSVDQMVQALVLGGTQITGVYRPSGAYMGKALFAGKAVAAGIENAYIAQTGYIAGYRLYEDGLCFGTGILSPNFDLEAAAAGLGEVWQSLNVDFCIHPAKKTYNANIDALLHILKMESLKFTEIDRINILSAYAGAHAHTDFVKPENSTEAFNSLHYIVAAAAHDGDYGFAQLEEEKYRNPEILAFAENNVSFIHDEELAPLVKQSWPGGMEVITKDGRSLVKKFTAHKGEIHNPLTNEELENKFRNMTEGYDAGKVESIIDIVNRLDEVDDIQDLTNLL
ncbi:MAG: MmgE/PrpD family protein [Rhodospirillaceae bacterium]|jgi:2-methylcitrate dehydratase PrpD